MENKMINLNGPNNQYQLGNIDSHDEWQYDSIVNGDWAVVMDQLHTAGTKNWEVYSMNYVQGQWIIMLKKQIKASGMSNGTYIQIDDNDKITMK